jgi:CheY-like chemotaxis protein
MPPRPSAAVLEMSGYEVIIAFSGAEALEIGARLRPQAVLLDIGMPGMTGYETARRIRLDAWGRHAVLIAVTGWGQDDDKLKAQAVGFDHHLTKPVDPDDIERLLAASLAPSVAVADSAVRNPVRDAAVAPPRDEMNPPEKV